MCRKWGHLMFTVLLRWPHRFVSRYGFEQKFDFNIFFHSLWCWKIKSASKVKMSSSPLKKTSEGFGQKDDCNLELFISLFSLTKNSLISRNTKSWCYHHVFLWCVLFFLEICRVLPWCQKQLLVLMPKNIMFIRPLHIHKTNCENILPRSACFLG